MAIRSKDVSLVPRKFLLEREERRVCSTGALVRLFDRHVNGKKLGACHGRHLTINCVNKSVSNK